MVAVRAQIWRRVAPLILLWLHTGAADECPYMPLTTEVVTTLAKRVGLMADVAAQKADFSLVFDATQELQVLEGAAASAKGTTLAPAIAMTFAQLMADCAKQEQEAHIQAAIDEAEAAGEVEVGEDGREGFYGTMTSQYESLDDVREVLGELSENVLELWQVISQPNGEWDQAGCRCTHSILADLFVSAFQPAAIGGCGDPMFSEMLMWVMLSASATCRI